MKRCNFYSKTIIGLLISVGVLALCAISLMFSDCIIASISNLLVAFIVMFFIILLIVLSIVAIVAIFMIIVVNYFFDRKEEKEKRLK